MTDDLEDGVLTSDKEFLALEQRVNGLRATYLTFDPNNHAFDAQRNDKMREIIALLKPRFDAMVGKYRRMYRHWDLPILESMALTTLNKVATDDKVTSDGFTRCYLRSLRNALISAERKNSTIRKHEHFIGDNKIEWYERYRRPHDTSLPEREDCLDKLVELLQHTVMPVPKQRRYVHNDRALHTFLNVLQGQSEHNVAVAGNETDTAVVSRIKHFNRRIREGMGEELRIDMTHFEPEEQVKIFIEAIEHALSERQHIPTIER